MSDLYRHLLLAADFAPETESVVTRAGELRRQCKARLSILHAVDYLPMSYSGDLVLADDFDLERELVEVARRQMAVLGERLEVAEADRHIETGATGRNVPPVAGEIGADLIVLGSHGLASLRRSTARTVLNGAGCDVPVVRLRE